MKLRLLYSKILVTSLLVFGCLQVKASHILGGELFYTYVSGNTYNVSMIIYGDCSGSPTAFQGLISATPEVQVYNGTVLISTIYLQPQSGAGVLVSPVCPDEINNTTCTPTGTLPGIKKYVYTNAYTLNGTSANWKFRTTGQFQNATLAGRSNSMTNVTIPLAGSLMSLEATLNNTFATNSSPTYTTIPTPFFCVNKPQEYNQGAVDPNSDSLVYNLVPGLDATTTPSTNVAYIAPFTATAPLGCAPGTYVFSNTTGQLSFTPNIVQRALVVSKVSEYRNGILIGTSMREMTFVVLDICTNTPPDGIFGSVVNATIVNASTLKVCKFTGTTSFNIDASDPDGDNITLSAQGLPAGVITNITNNGAPNPVFSLSWDISNVTPGTYTFFLTFSDDGCPLASKQTKAFTIIIAPKPNMTYSQISQPNCVAKAKFNVTPLNGTAPYALNVTQGATTVLNLTNINGVITDSLATGNYSFTITNADGCSKDTAISINFISILNAQASWTAPSCYNGSNGTATIVGSGNHGGPFQYAIGTQPYSANNTFTGLAAGTYVLHVKDTALCIKDTMIIIINPLQMILNMSVKKPVCTPVNNGQIAVSVTNGTAPYQYAINTGTFSGNASFASLAPGTYTIHVKDVNNCTKDTTITLVDSMQMLLQAVVTPIQCFGNTNGAITLTASGAIAAYSYALGTGTFSSANTFNNLGQGTYILHASDQNGCLKDTSIALVQPALLNFSLSVNNVLCFNENTGLVTVNATGGTLPYQYAIGTNVFQANNQFTDLSAGTYIIHLKDGHNCIKDTTITITQPATAITFGTFNLVHPTCETFTDGSVTMTAQGGTSPYQYSFNNGAFGSTANFALIAEGTYVFKARDNNGCEIDTSITLTGFPHIILDGVSFKLPTCNGNADGQMTLNASGGTPPFMYNIDHGNIWNTNPVFSNKSSGNYTLSVKDENGCTKDTLVFLPQPDKLSIDTALTGNDCNGVDNGGTIDIKVTGGTAPFQYNWQHNADLHTPRITGLVNGKYTIQVIDANGCDESATVEILYNNCCTPFIPNAFSPNGDNNNETFKVEFKGDMELKEMYVYNRYGQRIFSSSNINKSWDGTFNGKKVDGGTYFYYVRILCGNVLQKEITFKGDVTLIR
jgi:gliding motility-associated-like protein